MITLRSAAQAKAWSWPVGVVLSTGAMFLGFSLGNEAARLLGGEPGLWARMGKGFLWGGMIAGLQWPVVWAAGVPPVRFIAAGAVGFAIGYPLGQTVQAVIVLQERLSWGWGYGSALATFGLSLGLPQWWIFRRRIQRASLWIMFSVMGWIVTGLVWINSRPGDCVDACAYGLVTGCGLVWLVRSRPPNLKERESYEDIARFWG